MLLKPSLPIKRRRRRAYVVIFENTNFHRQVDQSPVFFVRFLTFKMHNFQDVLIQKHCAKYNEKMEFFMKNLNWKFLALILIGNFVRGILRVLRPFSPHISVFCCSRGEWGVAEVMLTTYIYVLCAYMFQGGSGIRLSDAPIESFKVCAMMKICNCNSLFYIRIQHKYSIHFHFSGLPPAFQCTIQHLCFSIMLNTIHVKCQKYKWNRQRDQKC